MLYPICWFARWPLSNICNKLGHWLRHTQSHSHTCTDTCMLTVQIRHQWRLWLGGWNTGIDWVEWGGGALFNTHAQLGCFAATFNKPEGDVIQCSLASASNHSFWEFYIRIYFHLDFTVRLKLYESQYVILMKSQNHVGFLTTTEDRGRDGEERRWCMLPSLQIIPAPRSSVLIPHLFVLPWQPVNPLTSQWGCAQTAEVGGLGEADWGHFITAQFVCMHLSWVVVLTVCVCVCTCACAHIRPCVRALAQAVPVA